MKRIGLLVLLALAVPQAARADFAAGMAAYEAGDYGKAMAEWLPLAEADDVAAMRNIGQMHRLGLGVPKDSAEAAKWYRRAAERGFDRAQANLATQYLIGDGVPQSYREAARWFDAAARQGHVISQYNIAVLLERGQGVPRNEAAALGWYNLAARAGHPEALERLSQLVEKAPALPDMSGAPPVDAAKVVPDAPAPPGDALPERRAEQRPPGPPPAAPAEDRYEPPKIDVLGKVAGWLGFGDKPAPASAAPPPAAAAPAATPAAPREPVAPANPAIATTELPPPSAPAAAPAAGAQGEGRDDRLRLGLAEYDSRNFRRALTLWQPLAEQGLAEAQFLVGRMYRNGDGMPPDRVMAWMWLHLAEQQGHVDALLLRAEIEALMTESELADARTMAANFRPQT